MPALACINCRAFHYGQCWNEPRDCWDCGQLGHIQRFCRDRQHQQHPVHDESLPGTPAWCNLHNLNRDPELKDKFLLAIRTYPGGEIWLDGKCLFNGMASYFESHPAMLGRPDMRGRPLAERITVPQSRRERPRSRSPSRERKIKRERSPLRNAGLPPIIDSWRPEQGRYKNKEHRSRSPLRLRPQPNININWAPQEPKIKTEPEEEYIDLTLSEVGKPKQQPKHVVIDLISVDGNSDVQRKKDVPMRRQQQRITGANMVPVAANRGVLGEKPVNQAPPKRKAEEVSANDNPHKRTVGTSDTPGPAAGQEFDRDGDVHMTAAVADPYFVLGVRRDASIEEILSAYEDAMWGLNLDRTSQGPFETEERKKAFAETHKALVAARRQLVGN